MDGVQQFLDFIETIEDDPRIGIAHISLYQVLLYEYIKGSFQIPIHVDRDRVMRKAKMGRKTYNKRLKELKEYGYIDYKPSSNPLQKSQVYFNRL